MPPRPACIPTLAALLALASLAPAVHAADSMTWTSGGVLVAAGEGDQQSPMLVADGAGGAIILWTEVRSTDNVLCAQHLCSFGTCAPGWPVTGLVVSSGAEPSMSTDDAQGAVVVWSGGALLSSFHIANGEPFAGPASAAALEPMGSGSSPPAEILKAPENRLPIVLPDGAGGMILGWKHMALWGDNLMFQRLTAAGAAVTNWATVMPTSYADYDPSMCSDGSAGAIFAWKHGYPDGDILAQRMGSDGAARWPASLALCAEAGNQRATGVVPDGAGGAIVVWRDGRNGSFEQIYAQRVTRDGAIATGWPAGGRAICTYAVDPGDSRYNGHYFDSSSPLVSDGAGGAFIVWSDRRADAGDIYCQHILPDGSLGADWPENGVALCAAPGLQARPEIAADGAGGALVCWEDARGGEADIYAQRVGASGTLTWPNGGLAVCAASGEQHVPQIVSDGASGAIITWQDARYSPAAIYAAHTIAVAVVPVPPVAEVPRLALGAPYPNPSRGEVRVPFALPGGAGGALELLDLSGRAIETHALAGFGPGAHVVRLAAGRDLPPGLYCVRLTHAGATRTARFAIVR